MGAYYSKFLCPVAGTFSDHMKVVWSGLESSGKSLRLAMAASDIAWRNFLWKKKSGIVRSLASNLRFSDEFEKYVTQELGIPILYWTNIDELIKLRNCDVFVDEVGNYFDSRLWADLTLDARRWLSQGAKMGIEMYSTAQDFAQVDKAFRRLTNHLFMITKLIGSPRPSATKPPVHRIWGVCWVSELDPQGYDEDEKKFKGSGFRLPSFFLITRRSCEIFDTLQRIERSKPMPYRHEVRECEMHGQGCDYKRIVHA